ncbi:hypothetical protein KIPB_006994 [Kipferlia bialata]|uniref:Uncharacterized protein n=1 Tax=Kipferlia bialata TaxID=797122 RepID=A0A9K3CXX6_9EUKA|nr:hypothetical protein KIPB_006994 [Kipferlia bialata]|eukprot:g6994.t1
MDPPVPPPARRRAGGGLERGRDWQKDWVPERDPRRDQYREEETQRSRERERGLGYTHQDPRQQAAPAVIRKGPVAPPRRKPAPPVRTEVVAPPPVAPVVTADVVRRPLIGEPCPLHPSCDLDFVQNQELLCLKCCQDMRLSMGEMFDAQEAIKKVDVTLSARLDALRDINKEAVPKFQTLKQALQSAKDTFMSSKEVLDTPEDILGRYQALPKVEMAHNALLRLVMPEVPVKVEPVKQERIRLRNRDREGEGEEEVETMGEYLRRQKEERERGRGHVIDIAPTPKPDRLLSFPLAGRLSEDDRADLADLLKVSLSDLAAAPSPLQCEQAQLIVDSVYHCVHHSPHDALPLLDRMAVLCDRMQSRTALAHAGCVRALGTLLWALPTHNRRDLYDVGALVMRCLRMLCLASATGGLGNEAPPELVGRASLLIRLGIVGEASALEGVLMHSDRHMQEPGFMLCVTRFLFGMLDCSRTDLRVWDRVIKTGSKPARGKGSCITTMFHYMDSERERNSQNEGIFHSCERIVQLVLMLDDHHPPVDESDKWDKGLSSLVKDMQFLGLKEKLMATAPRVRRPGQDDSHTTVQRLISQMFHQRG